MYLSNLKLNNFRNINKLELDFKNQVNVFLGKNGQGKTNIVESLYYLARAKSFRTAKTLHLINDSQSSSELEINFENDHLNWELKGRIEKEKKYFLLNEKKVTPVNILKKFPIVFFSPESLASIKEGPEYRRNLLDETIILEKHESLEVLFEFKKILNSRNKLLKDILAKKIDKKEGFNILESMNPLFSARSIELTKLRLKTVERILPIFKNCFMELTCSNVEITVDCGDFELEEKSFLKKLNDAASKEMVLGFSIMGPHKHDIKFLYNGKDSRFFSSQGQQRCLILAFKFSQIMYHKMVYDYYPIMILDDVFSELDRDKRKYLINFLKQSEAQAFLTTTDFESLEARNIDTFVFQIEEGAVRNHSN